MGHPLHNIVGQEMFFSMRNSVGETRGVTQMHLCIYVAYNQAIKS